MDPDPRFLGTEVHRIYTCPVLQPFREQHAPRWLLREVQSLLRENGGVLDLWAVLKYTRALVPLLFSRMRAPPRGETFEWLVEPPGGMVDGETFVDGSRLFAEHDLFNTCARHGWAFTTYDDDGKVSAAARGRPPAWVEGIHATELYGLLQAVTHSSPQSSFLIDCLAVKQGTRSGPVWAAAPSRRLARAWCPLAAALDEGSERVEWMPAHCSASLGNGLPLTAYHVEGNAHVDRSAKAVARRDRPPLKDVELVRREAMVSDIARWVGKATAFANHFPAPAVDEGGGAKRRYWRDTEASKLPNRAARKRKAAAAQVPEPVSQSVTGDLSQCPRA